MISSLQKEKDSSASLKNENYNNQSNSNVINDLNNSSINESKLIDSPVDKSDESKHQNITTINVGWVSILIVLIFVVGMLLLLYYFFNIMSNYFFMSLKFMHFLKIYFSIKSILFMLYLLSELLQLFSE